MAGIPPSALGVEEVLSPPATSTCSALVRAGRQLHGRTVWHINTTALGGGVAELLWRTVPAHEAAGISSRWLVTHAPPQFFGLTKQLHHLLHGRPGNGSMPDKSGMQYYRETTAEQAHGVLSRVKPGDLVILHDPQTLGLAPHLRENGLQVAWRSHIGTRRPSALVGEAWRLLLPFAEAVHHLVFSLSAYVPSALADRPTVIMPPAIDPTSPKCRPLSDEEVHTLLATSGLQEWPTGAEPGTMTSIAGPIVRVVQDERLPSDVPLVLQISRWDPLKDMRGVMAAFVRYVAPYTPAHLVLAGPDPAEVGDDVENEAVLAETIEEWGQLRSLLRRRVHLLILPLTPRETNHAIVNALQRRATVIAQKSLEEGFGLAVTEAMHKRRPIVATDVGGLREQIKHRQHGLLVQPEDAATFGAATLELLSDAKLAQQLCEAAFRRCQHRYLIEREHGQYADLFLSMLEA